MNALRMEDRLWLLEQLGVTEVNKLRHDIARTQRQGKRVLVKGRLDALMRSGRVIHKGHVAELANFMTLTRRKEILAKLKDVSEDPAVYWFRVKAVLDSCKAL